MRCLRRSRLQTQRGEADDDDPTPEQENDIPDDAFRALLVRLLGPDTHSGSSSLLPARASQQRPPTVLSLSNLGYLYHVATGPRKAIRALEVELNRKLPN